jgi:hypothetical protein
MRSSPVGIRQRTKRGTTELRQTIEGAIGQQDLSFLPQRHHGGIEVLLYVLKTFSADR